VAALRCLLYSDQWVTLGAAPAWNRDRTARGESAMRWRKRHAA